MPITEQTPDIDPITFKSPYPIDQRAASKKQDDSVLHSEWPVVTHSVYTALARGRPATDNTPMVNSVNVGLKQLCAARSNLANAMMFVDGALKEWNPKTKQNAMAKKMWARLSSLRRALESQLGKFPLEIR